MTTHGSPGDLDRSVSSATGAGDAKAQPVAASRNHPLPWSGPSGWRHHHPVLEARKASGSIRSDDGFSLVELMVALLVLAILMAVAIPTFMDTTTSAENRSVQANLDTALTDSIAQFENSGQTFSVNGVPDSAAFAGLLTASQLSMTFHAGSLGTSITQGSSGSLSTISVSVSNDGSGIVLGGYTAPGDCFYAVDNAGGLSTAAKSVTPYTGTAVTTTPVAAPSGPIALPAATGPNYVEVKGDTTQSDCNAATPRTSGPPATIEYRTSGFPN